MDRPVLQRVVGTVTLGVAAIALSFALPRIGLENLEPGSEDRVEHLDLRAIGQGGSNEGGSDSAKDFSASDADRLNAASSSEFESKSIRAQSVAQAAETDVVGARSRAVSRGEQEQPAQTRLLDTKPKPLPKPKPAPIPKPPPQPKVTQEAERPAKSPPTASISSAAAASGAALIQAGAFSRIDGARKRERELKNAGQECFLSPVEMKSGGTLYRVRCGPFANRAGAERAAARLKKKDFDVQVLSAES